MKRIGILALLVIVGVYFGVRLYDPGPVSTREAQSLPGAVATDPLCEYMHGSALECLALVADASTYRPGAITGLRSSGKDGVERVELPVAYLDDDCVVNGAKISDWAPESKQFQLRDVTYSHEAIGHINGDLSKGLKVNVGPAFNKIKEVDLSFGAAHTSLLSEFKLIDRVESCVIKLSCVRRILNQNYRVINRVLVADTVSYKFRDDSHDELSVGDLKMGKAIQVGAGFQTTTKNGEGLAAKDPLALGVSLISDAALRAAKPCTATAQYSIEGSAKAFGGGSGAEGHIAEDQPANRGTLGSAAAFEAQGSENTKGSFEQTASFSKARGLVDKIGDGEMKLLVTVDVHGGHYGFKGPFGPISGHDTGANSTAEADGRINVLFRDDKGSLTVSWAGVPLDVAGEPRPTTKISVVSPDGAEMYVVPGGSAEGSIEIPLARDGQFAVVGSIALRAETSGGSRHAQRTADVRIKARAEAKPAQSEQPISPKPPESPASTVKSDADGVPSATKPSPSGPSLVSQAVDPGCLQSVEFPKVFAKDGLGEWIAYPAPGKKMAWPISGSGWVEAFPALTTPNDSIATLRITRCPANSTEEPGCQATGNTYQRVRVAFSNTSSPGACNIAGTSGWFLVSEIHSESCRSSCMLALQLGRN